MALLVVFSVTIKSVPSAYAEAKESSNFEVFDILSSKDTETGSGETASENIKKAADASGNSIAAELLLKAINILILLVGTLAFIVLLISGFTMIYAQGDQNKIDSSKRMITQALLGLVFAFGSYTIVTFIQALIY